MKSRAPKHHNDEELNQLSKEQVVEIIKVLQAEIAKSSISKRGTGLLREDGGKAAPRQEFMHC